MAAVYYLDFGVQRYNFFGNKTQNKNKYEPYDIKTKENNVNN